MNASVEMGHTAEPEDDAPSVNQLLREVVIAAGGELHLRDRKLSEHEGWGFKVHIERDREAGGFILRVEHAEGPAVR